MRKVALILALLLSICALLVAQDNSQQQQDDSQKTKQKQQEKAKPQQQDDSAKPKPLFSKPITARSSQQKKDTTSLGFNGLDPQGKVEKALLESDPTPADEAQVQKLAERKVDGAALKKVLDDGHLNSVDKKKGGAQ